MADRDNLLDWTNTPLVADVLRAISAGATNRGLQFALEVVDEAVALAPAGYRGELEGRAAAEWTEAVLAALDGARERFSDLNAYHPFQWMWYLRRLPDALLADPGRNNGYRNRTIAEALGRSSRGAAASTGDADPGLAFLSDVSKGERIGGVIGYSIAIGRYLDMLLLCTHGARFEFTGSPLPRLRQKGTDFSAMALGLKRMTGERDLDRLGVFQQLSADPSAPASADDPAVLLLNRRVHHRDMSLADTLSGVEALPPDAEIQGRAVRHFYEPDRYALRQFADLLRNAEVQNWSLWHPELPTLLVGLIVAAYFWSYAANPRLTGVNLGYLTVARDELTGFYDALRPAYEKVLSQMLADAPPAIPETGEELLTSLSGFIGNPVRLVPGPGVIARPDGRLLLDFAGMSLRFGQVLSYPPEAGNIANIRGRLFEDTLQGIIDSTSWAPPSELRALVQRHFRVNGENIGEPDAIAHRDGITLLVSAKSIVLGEAYLRGEHSALREAVGKVRAALERWDEFIGALIKDPVGLNYDLSAAGQIVGVVVTPSFVLVPLDLLQRMSLPGLPSYVTAGELIRYLRLT